MGKLEPPPLPLPLLLYAFAKCAAHTKKGGVFRFEKFFEMCIENWIFRVDLYSNNIEGINVILSGRFLVHCQIWLDFNYVDINHFCKKFW